MTPMTPQGGDHRPDESAQGADSSIPEVPPTSEQGAPRAEDWAAGPGAVSDAGAEEPAAGETPASAADEPDYKDLYLRTAAELDNIRKRARRDVGSAEARGIARLARELLPALDNLDRALAAVEAVDGDAEQEMARGVRLVQQELAGALERVGIVADSPTGEAFDPHRHEAVAQAPIPGAESGIIVEVYQAGYRHGDEVLRAAKVVVAQ